MRESGDSRKFLNTTRWRSYCGSMELAMKTVLLCAEMSDDFNFSVYGAEMSHKSCFFEEWGLDKTAAVLYSDNNFIIKYNDREKVFP